MLSPEIGVGLGRMRWKLRGNTEMGRSLLLQVEWATQYHGVRHSIVSFAAEPGA